jgi:hypothetical protein
MKTHATGSSVALCNPISNDLRQCNTMKSPIFAFLLSVFFVTTNAFSIPSQMALGGVNGGKMHDLKSEHHS